MSISHIGRYDEKTLIWISTKSGTMGKYDVETSQCRVLLENLKRPISVRIRDSSVYVLEKGKTEQEGRLIKYNMDSGYVCIMLTRLCNARGMYVTSNHDVLFSEAEDETAIPDPTETCTLSSIWSISKVVRQVFDFAYGIRENDQTIQERYFGEAMYTSTYRTLYYERPRFPFREACSILSRRIEMRIVS